MAELQTVREYKPKPSKFTVRSVRTSSRMPVTTVHTSKTGYSYPRYAIFHSKSGEKMWETGKPVMPKVLIPPRLVLPSLHLFLGPFYVLLGIMSCVLVMDILYFFSQTTTLGFYTLLGDMGPTLTIVGAIIFVWRAYEKYKRT